MNQTTQCSAHQSCTLWYSTYSVWEPPNSHRWSINCSWLLVVKLLKHTVLWGWFFQTNNYSVSIYRLCPLKPVTVTISSQMIILGFQPWRTYSEHFVLLFCVYFISWDALGIKMTPSKGRGHWESEVGRFGTNWSSPAQNAFPCADCYERQMTVIIILIHVQTPVLCFSFT